MHGVTTKIEKNVVHVFAINCHHLGDMYTEQYKNVVPVDNVLLKYAGIKFTDVLLFILYMLICIETLSNKFFQPKRSNPCPML